MDRRKSIKALMIGTVGAGVLVEACTSADKKNIAGSADASLDDRMQEEKAYLAKMAKEANFFNEHEMATITVLGDIIMPKDEVSGSASDAKVPEFIEFIVKDMPSHQTPLRGGLRWLDLHCYKLYEKAFVNLTAAQQISVVDSIAYPEKAAKELAQGVSFFNLMRDLVTTGFYTTEIGIKDLGYVGNAPNQWNGVPDEVLKQYKLAYTEKELKECLSFDKV
ncbi:gluconate 2-dehydrogenase subunit 3 family protein [Sediminibacterium sp.]|uniref:gluconate 2-dehydrogenase subunit 3 family protein n=1 Tax=Sediminibacterium sp. TaxID=1917865 RepID=UPI00273557C1|nr:gluconate 2-dehydrogenase subunit 3 family protein [Sediminibacterium sp.]MDP3393136.1 gluconate 2-dehydrogenase subunit 3 family protein [Sediminibacterium sp.]MDP3567738.1 gluconate 2-dehydrogenase subunit 3 family protein [Sediminibacterium sp.]